MVVLDKNPLEPEEPLLDAPPSYNDVAASSSRASSSASRRGQYPPEKQRHSFDGSGVRPGPTLNVSSSNSAGPSSPRPAGWLATMIGTQQARQDQEVKNTVLGLLQDIIKRDDVSNAVSILQSCMDACRSRGLSFESIAQEPSIQGHTPLYWTIVKGVYSGTIDSNTDNAIPTTYATVFDALTSFPLTPATYSDALQACILSSSHDAYLQLRRFNPNLEPYLPGENTSFDLLDSVAVINGEDPESALTGAFRAEISIRSFQKRIRLFKELHVRFVARGRMWELGFVIYQPGSIGRRHRHNHGRGDLPAGSWIMTLDLVEGSPSTYLDSRVFIGKQPKEPEEPRTASPPPGSPSPTSEPRTFPLASFSLGRGSSTTLAPIAIRLKSPPGQQLRPDYRKEWHMCTSQVCAVLQEHNAGSLEFDGCPYIESDGTLNIVLEAKLVKPSQSPDCVFM